MNDNFSTISWNNYILRRFHKWNTLLSLRISTFLVFTMLTHCGNKSQKCKCKLFLWILLRIIAKNTFLFIECSSPVFQKTVSLFALFDEKLHLKTIGFLSKMGEQKLKSLTYVSLFPQQFELRLPSSSN